MTMKWYGESVTQKIDTEIDKRIQRAISIIGVHAKSQLMKQHSKYKGTGLDKRGLTPSKEGEYPRKVTGHLRRSVMWEYDRSIQTGRVGIGKEAEYGKWLELGTKRMRRRPWLSLAVSETASKVRSALKGTM